MVDTESMLVLVTYVTQPPNDKQQIEPMVAKLQGNPPGVNRPNGLLADSGYFSENDVSVCHAAGIQPLIAPVSCLYQFKRYSLPGAISRNRVRVRRVGCERPAIAPSTKNRRMSASQRSSQQQELTRIIFFAMH